MSDATHNISLSNTSGMLQKEEIQKTESVPDAMPQGSRSRGDLLLGFREDLHKGFLPQFLDQVIVSFLKFLLSEIIVYLFPDIFKGNHILGYFFLHIQHVIAHRRQDGFAHLAFIEATNQVIVWWR